MEFQNLIKNSNIKDINSSLQEELKEIDKIIENSTFKSRQDNSLTKDKKLINKIKLYFYQNEPNDDIQQKQINKLLSIIGKNYKNENQFKPLKKPKKISLIGKVFVNVNVNENIENNRLNIDKNFINNNRTLH